jgi:hypothetical protein
MREVPNGRLQAAAWRGLRQAQREFARLCGWSEERLARHPDGRPIRLLPGSWRSCARQAELHASDPRRFAAPEISGHPRGIAIDVDQSQPRLRLVNRALRRAGWLQARPDDEPWHWSWGVAV